MSKLELDSKNRVTLCGRPKTKCCPQMFRTDDGMVGVTDDYGGYVKMPIEDARMFKDGLETIEPLFEATKPKQILHD